MLRFDIYSEDKVLTKFYNEHQINVTEENLRDFSTNFSPLIEKLNLKSTPMNKDYKQKYISINNLKIGDVVKLSFIPKSQKYIEYYEEQNVSGRVFFIDKENDDAFLYRDEIDLESGQHIRIIQSFNREYCSYYGTTRGYSHLIHKLTVKRKPIRRFTRKNEKKRKIVLKV